MAATPVLLPALPASKSDLIAPFVEAILKDHDWSEQTHSHFDALSVCLACDAALETRLPQEVCYI